MYGSFNKEKLLSGFGHIFTSGKVTYIGFFRNGQKNGHGIMLNKKFIYTGNFVDNEFCGFGKYINIHAQYVYYGNFLKSNKQGYGALYNLNTGNIVYDGEWWHNSVSGYGTYYPNNNQKNMFIVYFGQLLNANICLNSRFYISGKFRNGYFISGSYYIGDYLLSSFRINNLKNKVTTNNNFEYATERCAIFGTLSEKYKIVGDYSMFNFCDQFILLNSTNIKKNYIVIDYNTINHYFY